MKSNLIKLINLYIAIMAAVFSGCKGDDVDVPDVISPDEASQNISLSPSRADLETLGSDKSFMLWAYKTKKYSYSDRTYHEDVFSNYMVSYNTDWYYNGLPWLEDEFIPQFLHYWDSSSLSYRFDAVYPWNDDMSSHVDYYDYNLRLSDVTANSINSTDVLVARHCRHINDINGLRDDDIFNPDNPQLSYPNSYREVVPLCFHHILSQIEFRAFCADGTAVKIKSLTAEFINGQKIYTQADFDSGTGLWYELESPTNRIVGNQSIGITLDTWDPTAITDYRDIATPIFSILEIPQNVKNKSISVTLKTDDDIEYTGTLSLSANWAPENRYIYYLRISGPEIILVDIEVASFFKGADFDVEDAVVNW